LKDGAQQYSSISKIARSVKFSSKFSLKEIEDRWRTLLYDPIIAPYFSSSLFTHLM
jgi:hypothetical protein